METMKVRKNFYELTEEDLQEMWERDMQAIKEGRYMDEKELLKRLEEEYGV